MFGAPFSALISTLGGPQSDGLDRLDNELSNAIQAPIESERTDPAYTVSSSGNEEEESYHVVIYPSSQLFFESSIIAIYLMFSIYPVESWPTIALNPITRFMSMSCYMSVIPSGSLPSSRYYHELVWINFNVMV